MNVYYCWTRMIPNILFNLELIIVISFVTWFSFLLLFCLLSLDRLFDIINILSHIVSFVCSHSNEKEENILNISSIGLYDVECSDHNVYTQLVNSFCDEQRARCSEINRRTSIKIVPCSVYRKNTIWIFFALPILEFNIETSNVKHPRFLKHFLFSAQPLTTYCLNASLSGFFELIECNN